MNKRALRVASLAAAVMLAAAACGDDDSAGGGGANESIKVGLLTSVSGPAAASFTGAKPGVEARLKAYKTEGGKCSNMQFDVVTADDQSSPQGALAAAQKLIQSDKVYSMLEVTPFFFGAAQYVTTGGKNTPTIGGAFDNAPQWLENNNNLFASLQQVYNYTPTYGNIGKYWKEMGVTKVGAVSYDNPASRAGTEQVLRSSDAAGISRGYVNDTVPLGSTDVGAIVLGIKNSGTEALYLPINPDTALAIVGGLRQAGANLKSIVVGTGYGADLLASPPGVAAAQGVSFISPTVPVELKTEGTERMVNALKEYAGSKSGIPSFSESMGYLSADLLIHGLEAAGCDASQEKFISTLRENTDWNAGGLFKNDVSFTNLAPDEQCVYLVKLEGNQFVPDPKASPICGKKIS